MGETGQTQPDDLQCPRGYEHCGIYSEHNLPLNKVFVVFPSDKNTSTGYQHSAFSHTTENCPIKDIQRFRLVKFIKKFKTRVKNLKIDKIFAFDQYLHELFFAFYFRLNKKLFLTLKNNEVADLTHFSKKNAAFFRVFKNKETVDCHQTFLNCF